MNELGHGPWEKGYEPSGINSNLPIYECGFNQGYKQAEKDTIERACKWLSRHYDIDLARFRKAMEEDEK